MRKLVTKRTTALFLAVVMIMGMVPTMAFGAVNTFVKQTNEISESEVKDKQFLILEKGRKDSYYALNSALKIRQVWINNEGTLVSKRNGSDGDEITGGDLTELLWTISCVDVQDARYPYGEIKSCHNDRYLGYEWNEYGSNGSGQPRKRYNLRRGWSSYTWKIDMDKDEDDAFEIQVAPKGNDDSTTFDLNGDQYGYRIEKKGNNERVFLYYCMDGEAPVEIDNITITAGSCTKDYDGEELIMYT